LAHETPTLTLPLSTWGGEEEGLQNVSRTQQVQIRYFRGWPDFQCEFRETGWAADSGGKNG